MNSTHKINVAPDIDLFVEEYPQRNVNLSPPKEKEQKNY